MVRLTGTLVFQANLKKFMDYVQLHSTDKVARLLDKGLDPNFHDPDSGGEELSWEGGSLLVTGTLILTCSLDPECPLSLAAQLDNSTDLLKVLRNGGAHLDFRTRDGLTAVHCATRQRNAGALTVSGAGPCSGVHVALVGVDLTQMLRRVARRPCWIWGLRLTTRTAVA